MDDSNISLQLHKLPDGYLDNWYVKLANGSVLLPPEGKFQMASYLEPLVLKISDYYVVAYVCDINRFADWEERMLFWAPQYMAVVMQPLSRIKSWFGAEMGLSYTYSDFIPKNKEADKKSPVPSWAWSLVDLFSHGHNYWSLHDAARKDNDRWDWSTEIAVIYCDPKVYEGSIEEKREAFLQDAWFTLDLYSDVSNQHVIHIDIFTEDGKYVMPDYTSNMLIPISRKESFFSWDLEKWRECILTTLVGPGESDRTYELAKLLAGNEQNSAIEAGYKIIQFP